MPIHPDAKIDARAHVHESVVAWSGTHVRELAQIGQGTSLGQSVYVGPGVVIGANCKIQNAALIYEPAVLGDGVFVGPRVVFTNDRQPRAITVDGRPKGSEDWTAVGVRVEYGAAIGAGAICVAPITIGEWSTIAAGAVVVSDVAPFALMAGVPAKRIGWVGRAGSRLMPRSDGRWFCSDTGDEFVEIDEGTRIVRETR